MDDNDDYSDDGTSSPIARIYGRGFEIIMRKDRIIIGRNSSKGTVDVDMGLSSFVSRNHLEVFLESRKLFLLCHGKNGIFVDNTFKAHGSPPLELPHQCNMRFPSTNTRIFLECLLPEARAVREPPPPPPQPLLPPPLPNTLSSGMKRRVVHVQHSQQHLDDLEISGGGPDKRLSTEFVSPTLSPTGTLSAANSCPASPRSANLHHVLHSGNRYSIGNPSSSVNVDQSMERTLTQVHSAGSQNMGLSSVRLLDGSGIGGDGHPGVDSGGEDAGNDSDAQLDRGSEFSKPPYSYAQMIVQAVNSTPDRQLTLSGIYAYIVQNFKYYKPHDKGWQNSIRHNLSLNRYFIKVPRAQDEPGKGSFWRIDPMYEDKLISTAYRKRRQRGIQVYAQRPPQQQSGGTTLLLSSVTLQQHVAAAMNSGNSGDIDLSMLASDSGSDTTSKMNSGDSAFRLLSTARQSGGTNTVLVRQAPVSSSLARPSGTSLLLSSPQSHQGGSSILRQHQQHPSSLLNMHTLNSASNSSGMQQVGLMSGNNRAVNISQSLLRVVTPSSSSTSNNVGDSMVIRTNRDLLSTVKTVHLKSEVDVDVDNEDDVDDLYQSTN